MMFCGCSNSQSDEFTEFSNLASAETSEPSGTVTASDAAGVQSNSFPEPESASTEQPIAVPVAAETVSSSRDVETTEASNQNDTIEDVDTQSATDVTANPIKLLIPHKRFRTEGNALRASFDDIDLLKALNMDPVPLNAADHFPEWLKNLNGRRVRVRGYMRPGYLIEDITEFLFVRDNGECCYGPLPKIYDMIAVTLADGESTDLIEGTPFDVEGTMRIEPHTDEVELYGLFFIDDGVIIE